MPDRIRMKCLVKTVRKQLLITKVSACVRHGDATDHAAQLDKGT